MSGESTELEQNKGVSNAVHKAGQGEQERYTVYRNHCRRLDPFSTSPLQGRGSKTIGAKGMKWAAYPQMVSVT